MTQTVKAICFDMDGLLFNTEDLFDQVGIEMLAKRGKQLDQELVKRMMGQQAKVALQLFKDHYELEDSISELQTETDELFEQILPDKLAPMTGAHQLLNRLTTAATRPLALTTSSHGRSVDRIMGIHDFRGHFSFRLAAEDIENGKPHPEIYLTAAEKFQIDPSEMLVFEDSENGCKAGVAAGAQVIAVPSKHSSLHSFDGCQFVADSLEDERIHSLLFAD
jgi:HAD superfamily hydrolase (TIGR01509 family)